MIKLTLPSLTIALIALPAFAAPGSGSPPSPPDGGQSRTYVIPHVLETSGRIDAAPDTFDTNVIVVDGRDMAGARKQGDVDTLALYLLDDGGKPLVSASGVAVCNPCQFDLDPQATRRHVISMEEMILASGGFPGTPPSALEGYGVVVVSGSDIDKIVVDAMLESSGATSSSRKERCCPGHVTLIK